MSKESTMPFRQDAVILQQTEKTPAGSMPGSFLWHGTGMRSAWEFPFQPPIVANHRLPGTLRPLSRDSHGFGDLLGRLSSFPGPLHRRVCLLHLPLAVHDLPLQSRQLLLFGFGKLDGDFHNGLLGIG